MLQEAEATARNAKIKWCEDHGFRVISIQHDGILVAGITQSNAWEVEAGMSAAATRACGYEVEVEVKID